MKGKGPNPQEGTRLKARGLGADPRTTEKTSREKEVVSSWRACPGLSSCLGLGLSGPCWSGVRGLVGPWCSWSGVSFWSLSDVGGVVSHSPVSRQVQIEGSRTVAAANLRTGRFLSGIHCQLHPRSPTTSSQLFAFTSTMSLRPSCGVDAWHAGLYSWLLRRPPCLSQQNFEMDLDKGPVRRGCCSRASLPYMVIGIPVPRGTCGAVDRRTSMTYVSLSSLLESEA